MWLTRQHNRRTLRGLVDALLLVRWCDEEDVRHVHAHFATRPATTASLGRKVAGMRYSVTAHAKDVYATAPRRLAARVDAAEAVVTCTEANRSYLERTVGLAPGTVRVLRHGIPLQPFLDVHRAPVAGRLLTVGRLMPKKGHDTVARAVARLVDGGRDLHWHIAGGGSHRPALERLVAELGLADRVCFLGSVTAAQVRAELAAAQLFVLAPRVLANGDRDGIPNVVLESMAAGVPVVTTAVSAIPEVIRDGETGVLVAPDDPAALAGVIEKLLDDPTLAAHVAAEARSWAIQHCDLERSVSPLAALLRDLAAAASPAAGRRR